MRNDAERIDSMAGFRDAEALKSHFMGRFVPGENGVRAERYSAPDLYSIERVTNIIPPITAVEDRDNWKPSSVYLVNDGVVAVGRVFYTKTSGEYLMEELILRAGDIFGEFEVPLSLFGGSGVWETMLPPRFNMTYGAWASGPSLNWAMAYPRYIPRDNIDPENAQSAVHPFHIKSKNIRPATDAEVVIVPIEYFEEVVRTDAEAMSWFLMNVLKKTRLYFEPPSPGYGRSPVNIVSRLVIRLLAHRMRLGIAVTESVNGRTSCRTFIGPTEWIKTSLNPYLSDLKEVIQSSGGQPKSAHRIPIFPGDLDGILDVVYHFPVKDLDDAMLTAMGCTPDEDRRENRYGLLTGMRIECSDLDYFMNYLLEKGE